MKTRDPSRVLCRALLLFTIADAACGYAKGALAEEKTPCSERSVQLLDKELNQRHDMLLPQLTTRAQADLRTQQRAWIRYRYQECASGNAACLHRAYGERLAN